MPNYDDGKELKCSFCGKPQSRVRKLIVTERISAMSGSAYAPAFLMIAGPHAGVRAAEPCTRKPEHLPTPQELKKVLDEYVIGQDRAKIALSVAV